LTREPLIVRSSWASPSRSLTERKSPCNPGLGGLRPARSATPFLSSRSGGARSTLGFESLCPKSRIASRRRPDEIFAKPGANQGIFRGAHVDYQNERLHSWRDIARYLHRHVRTVKRWGRQWVLRCTGCHRVSGLGSLPVGRRLNPGCP
jgi:hypothetical protein